MREIRSPLDGFRSPFGLARQSGGEAGPANLESLFAGGIVGVWYDFNDEATLFTDIAGTTPVSAYGDLVARVNDKSGNGNYAVQSTSGLRPFYGRMPRGGVRNQLAYSEALNNAIWTKSNATISADADGVADKIVPTADPATVLQSTPLKASTQYTFSAEFKAAGKNFGYIQINDESGPTKASFYTINLTDGTVGTKQDLTSPGLTSGSAAATDMGGGWWRLAVTFTSDATGTAALHVVGPANAANSRTVTVSGSDGVLVRNNQTELGASATAYQKVTAKYDVTETGVESVNCLYCDGARGMVSNAIPLSSAIDNVTAAIAGQCFQTALAILAQTSATGATSSWPATSGNWGLINSGGLQAFGIRGTAGTSYANGPTADFTQPFVGIGVGDVSADSVYCYENGSSGAQNTNDRGTGNWSASNLMYLFHDPATVKTNFATGYFTGFAVLPGVADTTVRAQINDWFNYALGAYD